MPAVVMTYDSLVADVQKYLERTDAATVDMIPTFISLAENVIASDIKFIGNLIVMESQMVIGQDVIQKPARWRKTVSMNITVAGERKPVLLRKYEYLREYAPDTTDTGEPKYYADYDFDHWIVAPAPLLAYDFEVLYYERVQPLDSDNQSNWFTNYAPQAMLYGTLLQCMPFLKNDSRIPLWKAQYDGFINSLKTEDIQRIADRQANALDT